MKNTDIYLKENIMKDTDIYWSLCENCRGWEYSCNCTEREVSYWTPVKSPADLEKEKRMKNTDICCSLCENCRDCEYSCNCKDSIACVFCCFANNCEDCHMCDFIQDCKKCRHSQGCIDCDSCYYCNDCVSCHECQSCQTCYACSGLKNKDYYVWNKHITAFKDSPMLKNKHVMRIKKLYDSACQNQNP